MSKMFFEPLEDRRMLSLVVDVRLPGGGKTTTVSKVGDVVNVEIWATATGSNADGSDEGLQIVVGSMLSTNVSGLSSAWSTLFHDPHQRIPSPRL